jgi:hypothetical protein
VGQSREHDGHVRAFATQALIQSTLRYPPRQWTIAAQMAMIIIKKPCYSTQTKLRLRLYDLFLKPWK